MAALRGEISFRYLKQFFLVLYVSVLFCSVWRGTYRGEWYLELPSKSK
jgi:hypothetical protein